MFQNQGVFLPYHQLIISQIDQQHFQKLLLVRVLKNYFDKLKNIVKEIFGEDVTIEILDPAEENSYVNENGKKHNSIDSAVEKNPFNPKYTFDSLMNHCLLVVKF